MTTRTGVNAAVAAVQLVACGLLIFVRVPLWAAIGLTVVIITGIALTTRQGALADGGQDFLALRLWDVFWLCRGGLTLRAAWLWCFGQQRAQPPP